MNRLKALRGKRYTQAEMARLLGVGRTTYTKYENGDICMSAEVLSRLSKLFDVSIDYILGDDRAENSELWDYREALRRDPERRMLFSLARNAPIDEVRRAVAAIDAMRRQGGGDEDDPA